MSTRQVTLSIFLVFLSFSTFTTAASLDLLISTSHGYTLRYDGITGNYIDVFVDYTANGEAQILFGPDGNLYTASNNGVIKTNGQTGEFIKNLSNTWSNDIAFGPDGYLYLLLESQVSRIDSTTGEDMGSFIPYRSGGLNGGTGMLFGPDNNLYVATSHGYTLRYNGITGSYIDVFADYTANGESQILFGPDGNLYTASNNGVIKTNGQTGEFNKNLSSTWSKDIAFGPDGYLYLLLDSQVLRIDSTTGEDMGSFVPYRSGGLNGGTGLLFTPEPATLLLLGLGILTMRTRSNKRKTHE